jgi:hypothetical protein
MTSIIKQTNECSSWAFLLSLTSVKIYQIPKNVMETQREKKKKKTEIKILLASSPIHPSSYRRS